MSENYENLLDAILDEEEEELRSLPSRGERMRKNARHGHPCKVRNYHWFRLSESKVDWFHRDRREARRKCKMYDAEEEGFQDYLYLVYAPEIEGWRERFGR